MSRKNRDVEDAMFRAYRDNPTIEGRNAIAERFMPMVQAIATTLAARLPRTITAEELTAFGYPGLLEAIAKYDPDRGFAFVTFASLRIRGQMIDELRQLDWGGRLTLTRQKKLRQIIDQFEVEHGHRPGEQELEDLMDRKGLDARQRRLLLATPQRSCRSLSDAANRDDDRIVGEQRTVLFGGLLAAPAEPDPDARLDVQEIIRRLTLPRYGLRSALMLRLRYLDGLTMREVGEALKVSESRISQLHQDLLRMLRAQLTSGRAA